MAENQEAGLSVYGVPEMIECTVSYAQLKDWLHRIPKEEERKSINEMVLTLEMCIRDSRWIVFNILSDLRTLIRICL